MQGPAGSLFGEDAAVFAGFTSTPITGAIGSRQQMHAQCSAVYASSHLCHVAEYDLANSATPVPAAGAWLDSSGVADGAFASAIVVDQIASRDSGRYTGRLDFGNCGNWTTTLNAYGIVLQPAGAFTSVCTGSHVVACCASPYRERFRGFTSATSTGAIGGRAQAHLLCGQELPGSHLCHVAEYHRAAASVTPPVSGAWVDASAYATPSEIVVESKLASSHLGRYTGRPTIGVGINCDNWTSAGQFSGLTVRPTGAVTAACSASLPLACCE